MEGRGGELPLQGQGEARLPQLGGDGRVPPGVPRLCDALAQRAARGVQAARRGRRLGSSLRHHELSGRSADRARADEVRRERHALSRLQARDVERGREDRARRSRGRVRGLHLGYGVGEISGHLAGAWRARQCQRRDLDHHAMDAARQPRHLVLAEDRLRPLQGHRCAGGQLGEDRRSPDPRRCAGRERVQAGARDGLREGARHPGRHARCGRMRPSAEGPRRLRLHRAAAARRSRHRRHRHRLRAHRARPRPRGLRRLDGECARAGIARHQHRDPLHRRRERRLHRSRAGLRRKTRHQRQGREGRRQRRRDQGADRGRHAAGARPAEASISAFLALEEAGDLPQHAAMVRRDGQGHR